MYKKNRILAIILGLTVAVAASAQTKLIYDTIPFEIVQDKFIFEASIDHKPVRLILDTGGMNLMVADSAETYGVTIIKNSSIADANARISTQLGSVKDFRLGKWMNWNVGKVTVVPGNSFFRELGVSGAVGGEFFSGVCLSIDRRNKRLMISYPYRPNNIPRNAGTLMEMGDTYHAVVPLTVGSERINILFDTGFSGFLRMGTNDYEKLRAVSGNIENQYAGYGILDIGPSGISHAVKDSIYKVRIPTLTLPGGKEFNNIGATVGQQSPATILGQRLFDYGVVMLDYPRGLFYFFPYEQTPVDADAETKSWNARILPIVDHFEVVATIGEAEAHIGDLVWDINGIKLSTQKLSETVVLNILDNSNSDTAAIMVGPTEKEARKIIIKKI
jgi:hypothetical protein